MNNQFGNNMPPNGNNRNGRAISYSVGRPGPNRGMNNRPPVMPMMSNGGNNKNYKALAIVCIVVVGFIFLFVLLDRTGVINLKKEEPKQEEKQEQPTEEKKVEEAIPVEDKKEETVIEDPNTQQMARLCVNRDAEGNYNNENIIAREQQIAKLPENTDPLNIWDILKGAVFCKNHVCYWYKEGNEHIVYAYSCKTNKNEVATFEELWDKIEAETMLSLACEHLDEQGKLASDYHIEGMTCSYYVCTLNYNGNEYRRECSNN